MIQKHYTHYKHTQTLQRQHQMEIMIRNGGMDQNQLRKNMDYKPAALEYGRKLKEIKAKLNAADSKPNK